MTDRSSFGPELRRAREARGLTLEEIAEVTKVSIALYRGLENNDLSRWPSGLFRRAFLRSYAEAVGLDPEDTCRRFVRLFPEEGDPVPEMHAVPPPAATVHVPPPDIEPPRLLLASVPVTAGPPGAVWRRSGAALVDVALAVAPGIVASLVFGWAWFWMATALAGAAVHVTALGISGRTAGAWWLLRETPPLRAAAGHSAAAPSTRRPVTEGPVLVASRPQPARPVPAARASARRRR
jgi:transcriptional regulator with XRE-family HTH domain